MCHRNMKIISMSSVMVMNITILNIQVVVYYPVFMIWGSGKFL